MKKSVLFLAVFLAFAGASWAASSATETVTNDGFYSNEYILTISATTDTDGSFTNYLVEKGICGYVLFVVTDPGTTAPTNGYGITLTDSLGVDVMGGTLTSRSSTASEQVLPRIGGGYGPRFVCGDLTLGITGNSVNSATVDIGIHVAN